MSIKTFLLATLVLTACGSGKVGASSSPDDSVPAAVPAAVFDRDSAYRFVEELVAVGPRVPNTEAHRNAGDLLAARLAAYGFDVIEQRADLTAFDGTILKSRNIFGRLNPESHERLLLLAHWDSRPWADQDPDVAKRGMPVDGANDGASGVGVLLEIARQLGLESTDKGIDILFVDAEDWGDEGDEESWALGTAYFVNHPPVSGYRPQEAVLLDMVGSPDARFGYEYFSSQSNPALIGKLWSIASELGHDKYFHRGFGGAVTDDHVMLIEGGIPAIDIIDYRQGPDYQGFDPVWHTASDNMDNISRQTLGAVGEVLMYYIRSKN